MVRAVLIGFLLVLVSFRGAHAEEAKTSCERLRIGYEQITSAPISAEDGSLSIAINAFVDAGFMWKDRTYTQQSTSEEVAEHLKKLTPLDSLIWVAHRYGELEIYLQKFCGFMEADHKDISLLAPKHVVKPDAKTCGSPTLPDLSKPFGK